MESASARVANTSLHAPSLRNRATDTWPVSEDLRALSVSQRVLFSLDPFPVERRLNSSWPTQNSDSRFFSLFFFLKARLTALKLHAKSNHKFLRSLLHPWYWSDVWICWLTFDHARLLLLWYIFWGCAWQEQKSQQFNRENIQQEKVKYTCTFCTPKTSDSRRGPFAPLLWKVSRRALPPLSQELKQINFLPA